MNVKDKSRLIRINLIAKDLRTPKYRKRTEKNKKAYDRKKAVVFDA